MQQSGHSCGHVQCEGGGVYSYSRATRSGGRSLLQLVPAILFGTSQRTTVTRTRPHGCGELRGVRGAFCAPIATPHAEPPLNGVYGLSRVTQGLSERAASALKGLWPSGAWWQRPRTKAKRAGSTQQSILASAVVVPRNIVHAAVANNQCPASTTRGRKSPQGKTG